MIGWLLLGLLAAGAVIAITGILTRSKLEEIMRDRGMKRAIVEMVNESDNVLKLKDLDDETDLEIHADGIESGFEQKEVIVINAAPIFDAKELLKGLDYFNSEKDAVEALHRLRNDSSQSPVRMRYIEEMKGRLEAFDKKARTITICGWRSLLLDSRDEAEKAKPIVSDLEFSWYIYSDRDPKELKAIEALLKNPEIPAQVRTAYQKGIDEFKTQQKKTYEELTKESSPLIRELIGSVLLTVIMLPFLIFVARHWTQWNWGWGLKTLYAAGIFVLAGVFGSTRYSKYFDIVALASLYSGAPALASYFLTYDSSKGTSTSETLGFFGSFILAGAGVGVIKEKISSYLEMRKKILRIKPYLL